MGIIDFIKLFHFLALRIYNGNMWTPLNKLHFVWCRAAEFAITSCNRSIEWRSTGWRPARKSKRSWKKVFCFTWDRHVHLRYSCFLRGHGLPVLSQLYKAFLCRVVNFLVQLPLLSDKSRLLVWKEWQLMIKATQKHTLCCQNVL